MTDARTRPPVLPREIPLGLLFACSPARLQIGMMVVPPSLCATCIWLCVSPTRHAVAATVAAAVGTCVMVIWLGRVRGIVACGDSALATITGLDHPTDWMVLHLFEIRYRFTVDGNRYRGLHTMMSDSGLQRGAQVWVPGLGARSGCSTSGPIRANH